MIKFNEFQSSNTASTTDQLVGYTNTSFGGERRWSVETILSGTVTNSQNIAGATGEGSVVPATPKSGSNLQFKKIKAGSGISIIDGTNDIIISMDMNIGNYPYLEYAWVTAPNAASQTLVADVITTLTINTELADTGNFGSLYNNQITLQPGTYMYEGHANYWISINTSMILGLYNITDGRYIQVSGPSYIDASCAGRCEVKGQFTIISTKTFDMRIALAGGAGGVYNGSSNQSFQITTAGADQRTTLKLWKVG